MQLVDILIFIVYFGAMLGIGYYFMRKNETEEDYYVGSRNLGSWHIGLSVVATDVGGGFSIGLGGLGFAIGLAGSWLLFTGLVGAWVSAVLIIPKIWKLAEKKRLLTFPQLFEHFYDKNVALLAGIISAIGYIGFTSSQMLAGAKLADAAFLIIDQRTAVYIMGIIIVGYTAMGGLKAVVYTDTVQWSVLIIGLVFIGIPVSYYLVGGWPSISETLPDKYFSLTNVSWQQIINWIVTIVPIWFVGMTLYQRIYASKSTKSAQKAWFIAGLFEWPVMAFMGVILGLLARVAADKMMFSVHGYNDPSTMDPELGLPLLLVNVLPVGLLGIMMSAYFSAIMSTADSCLMAASGNVLTDILKKIRPTLISEKRAIMGSQIITLLLGALALFIAVKMSNVLQLMLYSYAFMVSGLFIPVIGALFLKNPKSLAAFIAMLAGGGTTITLILFQAKLPFGLDPNVFGISFSAISFFIIHYLLNNREKDFYRKELG